MAQRCHDGGNEDVQDAADYGAGEEEFAAADTVDEGEDGAGCEEEDYVLNC